MLVVVVDGIGELVDGMFTSVGEGVGGGGNSQEADQTEHLKVAK